MMHICRICGYTREGTLPTEEDGYSDEDDEMLQHQHEWVSEDEYYDEVRENGLDAWNEE